ncbi:integrase [Sporosarcina sp. JAI121]|uniref:integrase n=1 Tax=Sporosarcina sp. JAI121 TaxID=2723064 RepID=UPI0015CB8A8A|nr:integrase [Sporosarcina sp. JAI121]NYF24892.1 hypothetical protein [Sporosarcina sp. JAI121]
MKERSREKRIKQLIRSTMKTVGIDIELKQQRTGVNMSYNFIRNYVGFDVRRLQEARRELEIQISLETYIKIFTLHELGHSVDREALLDSLPRTMEVFKMKRNHTLREQYNNSNLLAMIIEEHVSDITFEETAWTNAEELNRLYRIVEPENFDKVKAHSLATYMNLYNNDLNLYHKLLTEQSEQIT